MDFCKKVLKKSIMNKPFRDIFWKGYALLNEEQKFFIWKKLWFYNLVNPFSSLENEYKFIFIHVPKTAGTAIIKTLFNQKSTGHYYFQNYRSYDKQKSEEFFSFAIVRNPWDRMVSSYMFLKQGGMNQHDLKFSNTYLKEFESFESFIYALRDYNFRKKILNWIHFIPQYKFVCDENENVKVKYIGKYENIGQAFDFIKQYFNMSEKILEVINTSDHNAYWSYYTNDMVEIVGEIYKKDIELFQYKFPYDKLK